MTPSFSFLLRMTRMLRKENGKKKKAEKSCHEVDKILLSGLSGLEMVSPDFLRTMKGKIRELSNFHIDGVKKAEKRQE
ncbi:hypothetical protein CSUI_004876 [Cystoisospora suis]|uniref:Uncharacterized protein n=1 Tax=Cystoisospora suis TaxID=483139 RepID=A0A2C6K9E9_9APIC|nr:hypothetical protein CSUI_004876 [Cystoisospora suis]